MAPCLEDLSNEIIEIIVLLLDLDDIRSLRLSCRTLAIKAAQNHFESYYLSKHVDATDSALQTFSDVTQPGRLGCLVEHLVLVGVVDDRGGLAYRVEDSSWEGEAANFGPRANSKLLDRAFSNILANGRSKRLRSLSLEVVVLRGILGQRVAPTDADKDLWISIWGSASDLFHATFGALAASTLPIERLNMYNDRHRLQRCSLACNELSGIDFNRKGLAVSLTHLTSLSISLSARLIPNIKSPRKADCRSAAAKASTKKNFIGLARLLQCCNQLKDLEIHYYQIEPPGIYNEDRNLLVKDKIRSEQLLQALAEAGQLPDLKKCTLRGLYVRNQDLLAFLKRTNIRHLFMEFVILRSGSFNSVFDYCSSEDAGMEELYLDYLIEFGGKNVLFFDGPGQIRRDQVSIPRGARNRDSTNTLHRTGTEIQRCKTITSHRGRSLSSGFQFERHKRYNREYGDTRG